MKKTIILMATLLVGHISLVAQKITREQADKVVADYVKSEMQSPDLGLLYVRVTEPSPEGVVIITAKGEKFSAKYACWTYCWNENPGQNEPSLFRYLFVKEDSGNLLEVIASNDLGPVDSSLWMAIDILAGLADGEVKSERLFPNPVGDCLTIPCNGNQVHVEIYDLKGTRFFSGLLSEEDSCQLNVSFLSAGIYLVNVSGETYKIIKK